jgi:hypothetical protein
LRAGRAGGASELDFKGGLVVDADREGHQLETLLGVTLGRISRRTVAE